MGIRDVVRVLIAVVVVLGLLLAGNEFLGAGATVGTLTVDPEPGAVAHTYFRSDPATDIRLMIRSPTVHSADPYSTDVIVQPEGGSVEVGFIVRRGIRELQRVERRVEVGQSLTINASRWTVSSDLQSMADAHIR